MLDKKPRSEGQRVPPRRRVASWTAILEPRDAPLPPDGRRTRRRDGIGAARDGAYYVRGFGSTVFPVIVYERCRKPLTRQNPSVFVSGKSNLVNNDESGTSSAQLLVDEDDNYCEERPGASFVIYDGHGHVSELNRIAPARDRLGRV